jgi:hypothetical protein
MNERALPPKLPAAQRLLALSRWENEGGALGDRTPDDLAVLEVPPLTNTELVHLRVRVIAAENLLLALLAEATVKRRKVANDLRGKL